MNDQIKIKTALISVYSKDGVEGLARELESYGIQIISTGGTFDFLVSKGIHAISIESITSYPSILGGRVKTLHPKIFGGILWRRDQLSDVGDVEKYEIPSVDLVVVDLYPFEKTVATTSNEDEIIEKIDIGGITLIRAAAKNYAHVVVVPSADSYQKLIDILSKNNGFTNLSDRRLFAARAFNISSHYDTEISIISTVRKKFRHSNKASWLPAPCVTEKTHIKMVPFMGILKASIPSCMERNYPTTTL